MFVVQGFWMYPAAGSPKSVDMERAAEHAGQLGAREKR